jgi:hypothetical protein
MVLNAIKSRKQLLVKTIASLNAVAKIPIMR